VKAEYRIREVHVLGTRRQEARCLVLLHGCWECALEELASRYRFFNGTWSGMLWQAKLLSMSIPDSASGFSHLFRNRISVNMPVSLHCRVLGVKAVLIPLIPLVVSPNPHLYWPLPYTNAKQTGPYGQWVRCS